MANRRDLHVAIDADDRGFGAAFEDAQEKTRGLDRELSKLERQQAAQEKVTTRTSAALQKFATTEDKAALAARRMGMEVKRAADQAEKAEVRAAAAAEAAAKGLLDKEKAAKLAARADDAVERAALKAAEAQLAEAAAAEKVANEERKAADAADKHKTATAGVTGGLLSAGAAAAALAVPLGAAGVAAIGFAAVAAPAIAKVITAQTDLATNWGTLDKGQKVAASSVQSLIVDYKTLAKSYEPDALQVFNGAVSTARGLLPELGKTVDATKNSVADFATSVENTLGREVPRLAGIVRSNANPALNELGTTFDQTSTLAVSLVHDLAPMGLQLLGVANGGLRFLNALEQINPHLVEVGATMLAVRAPASALGNLWVGGATKLGRYGKAAGEAEKTTATLGKTAGEAEKTTATLSKTVGSSPNIYIGAALAVGLLSYRWATAKSALDNNVDAIRAEANATKNSVATHQQAIVALGQESVGWTTYNKAVAAGDAGLRKHASAFDQSGSVRIRQAIDAEKRAVQNITEGENALGKQYSVTATQADQLATAAGVDLSKGITGSGAAAKAAQVKIDQYVASVKAASDPTFVVGQSLGTAGNKALDLQTRMTALTNAFGALAGPELDAYDLTTKTANAFDEFSQSMKASHGSMSLTTADGRSARDAFGKLLSTVEQNIDAAYTYDSATKGAAVAEQNRTDSARKLLPVLLAQVGGNKQAQQALLDWANAAGLGKTRSDALAAAALTTKSAFLAAAADAGKSRGEALKLWAAYQKLAAPLKLSVDDADFLSKLHNAQGLTIDPKTGLFKGDDSDYFNKWLKSKGLTLNSKTGRFVGNNSDYYNKWLTANHLHIDTKTGKITGNTSAFWGAVNSIPSVVGNRQINVRYVPVNSANQPGTTRHAMGGIDRYAAGGVRRDLDPFVAAQPTVLFGETETGGEAFIPLGSQKRKRSTALLSDVAGMFGLALVKPMADGGIMSFADGGTAADISLSTILSDWTSAVKPSTKAQVDSAAKSRRTQVNQLASAEDALAKARKKGSSRDIAAAERRIATERSDLAAATSKLADVEARYKFTSQKPATQLGSALGMDIKAKAAFIKNLTTLTNAGYGPLAQQLLAMGDSQAEKIAADAVKLSSSKLKSLSTQVTQSQQQATQLANLPAILTATSAIKGGAGGSWVGLLTATGLTPDVLAIAVNSMLADLGKTAQGKALVADMHAHGYARGGEIVGPPGVDRVPLWGTAGEYVIPRGPAAANRPLLDAIRQGVRVPVASAPVRGGDGASAGPQISQTFQTQDMDTHQLARESAREIAWMLR